MRREGKSSADFIVNMPLSGLHTITTFRGIGRITNKHCSGLFMNKGKYRHGDRATHSELSRQI